MVSSSKLAKLSGWLLIVGTLVAALMVLLNPGRFTTEHPDGATATMVEVVENIAASSGAAHLSVEVSLFAAFAYLVGFYGVERLLRDGSWGEYLRKIGFLAILAGFAVSVTSFAMGHLLANTLTHGMEGAGGSLSTTDAAVLLLGIEGTLVLFASLTIRMGIVLVAISLMNVRLIGPDRIVAILLAIVPGLATLAFVLVGSHVHEGAVNLYLLGSLMGFIQVVWVVLLGIGLIRKSDTLPALS